MTKVFILYSLNLMFLYRVNTISLCNISLFWVLYQEIPYIRWCFHRNQCILIMEGPPQSVFTSWFFTQLFSVRCSHTLRCCFLKKVISILIVLARYDYNLSKVLLSVTVICIIGSLIYLKNHRLNKASTKKLITCKI